VGHTWSLSLEEQFYLFWPACLHWLGRKRALLLGVALMLLAPVMRLLTLHLAPGYTYDQQMDRMFHTRVDTIMAGCVLALMGAWPPVYRALVRGVNARWTSLAAIALLLATLHLNWSNILAQQAFGLTAEAILLAYLISSAIANANTLGGRLLNLRGFRHLGVISYGLYLWQQLFDGPVDLVRGHPLLRLVAILAAAELSYHLVEKSSYTVRDRLLASRAS
jgi:peptidoglycan/LPS O-acetylase OafA/YrhL